MAIKVFAAIVIGSMETEMRIYELSQRKGMKEIDCISTRLGLGEDAYSSGKLDMEKVEELCAVLNEFRQIMQGYHVDEYETVATSAFREIRSSLITRDYIENQTGMQIRVLSNSEQRFLDYKSIASESSFFEPIIQSGTAIVDIGGNSMQVSVFDKDKLITTQNIRIGKVLAREMYFPAAKNLKHYEAMLRELVEQEMNGFGKLYQKERQIRNLLVDDSDLLGLVRRQKEKTQASSAGSSSDMFNVNRKDFMDTYNMLMNMEEEDIVRQFDLTPESARMIVQSMVFCSTLMEKLGAETLWLMDVSICDGLCYDYGIRMKILRKGHNFEEDIIAASRVIAKRYKSSKQHVEHVEELCIEIFNKTRKIHGLGQRERLLLQIAAILHDCGKYISLTNYYECVYNIVMATEIIGLSHRERRMIATIVRFDTAEFGYYDDWFRSTGVTREEYIIITKLTAILRIANALDRSCTQKCRGASVTVKNDQLQISVATQEDLTLEALTLEQRADFFEEVFSIRPVIRQKKKL